mgnify:CR=1 FL=1
MNTDALWSRVEWKRIDLGPPEKRARGLPVATHEGTLTIGDTTLKVYTLSTGQRVIDGADLERFFLGEQPKTEHAS